MTSPAGDGENRTPFLLCMLKFTNMKNSSSESVYLYFCDGQEIVGRLIWVCRPLTLWGNRNSLEDIEKNSNLRPAQLTRLSLCPACSLYGLRMLKVRGWRRGHMLDSGPRLPCPPPQNTDPSREPQTRVGSHSRPPSSIMKRQQRESCT